MEGTGNREPRPVPGTSRGGQGTALATVLGIIGMIVLGSGLVFGQGFSAAISGIVRDATGAVVPEATVTARNIETGLTRTTQTGVNGGYTVPSLPVGPYELTVEKPGFKQQVRMGITLAVAQEAVVSFSLEVGTVQQTVEVTGEAPIVNTTLASTSGLITEGQIKDMPLNGRSFEQLLTLNTGTVNNNSNSEGSSFSVAGKRTETNRFTMNGVDYVGANSTGQYIAPQGASQQLLGVDAVREYNVLGHTYGAEYGKRAGGQITVVTMSGTNQLHGAAFEYLRNSALDTRNFFDRKILPSDPAIPPFKRNQFGGSLGGPLIRDKMFAFGNYEGFRQRLGVTSTVIVPSLQARRGLLPDASGVYAPVPNLAPGMLPFFRYWPEPNGPELLDVRGLPSGTAYHYSNPPQTVQEDFGLARYDYNVSAADSFSTNFTVSRGHRIELPGAGAPNPVFFANPQQQLYTLGVQETHIFSPTVLNVALFGYSRAGGDNVNRPVEAFPENLLFLKGENRNNPGAITFGGGAVTVLPTTIVPANGNNPQFNRRRNFTGSNDLRMTMGRHNLSLGVWFMRLQQSTFGSGQQSAGSVSYLNLLAFLQDQPLQFLAAVNPTELNFRSTEAAWYFQDEIKLRPNLTVRLGLRDEMTTGWNEKDGHASNYNFDQNGIIRTHPSVGKSPFIENHALALWQPRVGVAWDPSGAGKWSVRAGFGIHNDLQDNLTHRLNSNQPFNARLQITDRPLLSFIPLLGSVPPPPSCSAESPLREPACAIFAPGGLDPAMHTPTIQQWSLTVERAITPDLAVQLSYVGSESYHVSTSLDMNPIQPLRCEDPRGCLSGGIRPARLRVTVPQGTEYIPVGTRPNRFVGSTLSWWYLGTSSYQGGSVSLLKRSRGGLSFKSNYTWSKVMDINSAILPPSGDNEPATILNRFNMKLNRGIGSYSLQHQFNTNFSYQLPFGRGKAFGSGASGWVDKLIGGWQWNGIFNAQSGFPITPIVGFNQSGNGDTRIPDVPNRNPDFQGKVIRGVDAFKNDPEHRWFNPNAFLIPPTGTFGNVGRGAYTGPGLVNLDMSLFKRIPLKENWNLQLRAEAFNILNHPNFDTPNPVVFSDVNLFNGVFDPERSGVRSGTGGVITKTASGGNGRQIQLALRLEF